MACWNCPRYSRPDLKCLDGKTNPRKKTDTVVVVEMLGLRSICHYNPYRDTLAQRIHYPNAPATRDMSARTVKKRVYQSAEPDIVADSPVWKSID
jgi:hypothetical protein